MKLKFENARWLWVVGIVLLLSAATAFAVPVTVPTLPIGAQYRLAFVTSETTDATRGDIAYYNNFVTNAAENVPELDALGTTWTAIASTADGVDARDNTQTNTSVHGDGVPIFLLNGDKLVDNYLDLWDGDVDAPLDVNEWGAPIANNHAWTGSDSSGMGLKPLGSSEYAVAQVGKLWREDEWIEGGLLNKWAPESLYALSGTLTVTSAPIPEPSTLVLFGVGFLGLVGYIVRRKCRLSD